MRLVNVTFLLVGAVALLCTAAQAGESGKSYDPRAAFAEADTNKDGSVDLGEFHVRLIEVFFHADSDKDGYLVIAEYRQLPVSSDFEKADQDNDSKLSLQEFIAIRYQEFKEADHSEDGALSETEVVEAFEGAPR